MAFGSGLDNGGNASIGIGNQLTTDLLTMLAAENIQPGSEPSYQLCKTIFAYHPLGLEMTETPIRMAQSQKREISIAGSPEKELKEAFEAEWKKLGADKFIRNTATLSRVYGIASIVIVDQQSNSSSPLDLKKVQTADISFNIMDPLNTAGSLILDQDPNSFEYMKPTYIRVGSKTYHSSRTVILMNEQPIYIEWSNSAFGFTGRSVFQRCLYMLKSYIQTVMTDDLISAKAGMIIYKAKSPGSIIDQPTRNWFGLKRQALKGGITGSVANIGVDEDVEALDLKNIKDAAEFSRENILKNIASASGMPASIINKQTLTAGFGEGDNDAKLVAQYIAFIREEMEPIYNFFDSITMIRAWNPDFYKSMQRKYPEQYGNVKYETAFYAWKNAFNAKWPNFLTEPDSEKAKGENDILKAALGAVEVLAPMVDPENRATIATWLADVINSKKLLFTEPLVLDADLIAQYEPPILKEPENPPESGRD